MLKYTFLSILSSVSVNNIWNMLFTILGSLITLFFTSIYNDFKNKKSFEKIKNAFFEYHIKPVSELIEVHKAELDKQDNLGAGEKNQIKATALHQKLIEIVDNKIKRLNYFRKNELPDFNSDNKLKLLRLTGFTLSYLKLIHYFHSDVYPFTNTKAVPVERILNEQKGKSKCYLKITQNFKETIDDYINLESSEIINESEKASLEQIILKEV